jgi:glycerophosphoryl diester phosphodiesterase
VRDDLQPAISWHRGGGELAPSGSRAAFVAAVGAGAAMVEVDVRQSRDGILVCHHDEAIPELGVICEVNLKGRNVFTLSQFLDDLDEGDPERRVVVHFDLKAPGYELAAVDALIDRGRPFFVTTGEEASIILLRRMRPAVAAYLTIGRGAGDRGVLAMMWLRCTELFPERAIRRTGATGIAIHHQLAWWPTRWWCERRGLPVVVWTIDDDAGLDRWIHAGVAVVTTNVPVRATRIRAQALRQRNPC